MNNKISQNVQFLLESYGRHIKNNKQLVLLYWQKIDGVEMDRESISTTDFLNKATSSEDIVNAKVIIDIVKRGR